VRAPPITAACCLPHGTAVKMSSLEAWGRRTPRSGITSPARRTPHAARYPVSQREARRKRSRSRGNHDGALDVARGVPPSLLLHCVLMSTGL
jgi:hypothetical protein